LCTASLGIASDWCRWGLRGFDWRFWYCLVVKELRHRVNCSWEGAAMSSTQVWDNDFRICALCLNMYVYGYLEDATNLRLGTNAGNISGKCACRCRWWLGYLRAISTDRHRKHSNRTVQRACKIQTNLNNQNGFNAMWIFQGEKRGSTRWKGRALSVSNASKVPDLILWKVLSIFLSNLSAFQTSLAKLPSWIVKGLGRYRSGSFEGCFGVCFRDAALFLATMRMLKRTYPSVRLVIRNASSLLVVGSPNCLTNGRE